MYFFHNKDFAVVLGQHTLMGAFEGSHIRGAPACMHHRATTGSSIFRWVFLRLRQSLSYLDTREHGRGGKNSHPFCAEPAGICSVLLVAARDDLTVLE